MSNPLISLLTGAAMLAAPVSLCLAQVTPPPAQPPAAATPRAARSAGDTVPRGLPVDGIAGVVGDQVVLISEMMAEANRRRTAGAPVATPADLARLQKQVLQELMEAELLVQAAKAEKVESNESELQKALDGNEKEIRSRFRTDAEFRAALRENGFGSLEEWRRMQTDLIRRDNLQRDVVQKLRRDGKMTAVNVGEAEVTEAFEVNKASLPRKPARVGLRQIVLATQPSEASKARARAKIDSIRAELVQHPDDFESMAKKESMDIATKDLGGDLGWNRRGRMLPAFDRMMFALNPGVVSPIVETGYGYHIIRVDRVQPAEVKARHILIRPTVDSTDEARTRAMATEVAEAWRKGASLDSLTIRYHDEAGGEDKTIPEYIRDSLPEAYRNAIEGRKQGDVLDPFPIADPSSNSQKFVVAQITFLDEAGEYTLAEMRDRIRSQLSEERSMRRLIDAMKKQTYWSVRYDPTLVAITP